MSVNPNELLRTALTSMTTLLVARFMLNDVPHAAGLLGAQPSVLYHATTLSMYEGSIKTEGLIPQPLRSEVASILGFNRGTYLANNLRDTEDIALTYARIEPTKKFVFLKVSIPPGTRLYIDPEVGEPDSPWFVTTDVIPPRNIDALCVKKYDLSKDSFDVPHAVGFTGNSSVAEELKRHSKKVIADLSTKYGVVPPLISWRGILDTGWYMPHGWIVMSTAWQLAFCEDPKGTKDVIRRTLAHEFCHYLYDDPSLIIILPPGKAEQARTKRLLAHETDCDDFAYAETGIDLERESAWWELKVAPVLASSGWVKKTEREIEERGYILNIGELTE